MFEGELSEGIIAGVTEGKYGALRITGRIVKGILWENFEGIP